MPNKYFNENEFQYALDTIDKNPFEAKVLFDKYLDKFPKDYYARAYYVILLERLDYIDLAIDEYKMAIDISLQDPLFDINTKRKRAFKCIMALAKIKILASKGKYQKLIDYYEKNIDLFDRRDDTNYLLYYSKAKLGLLDQENIINGPYRFLQSVNYSEERFKKHITKHQDAYNINEENSSKNVFFREFPINEVILEIKKFIPSSKRLCPGLYDNVYYFKYDNCGRINGKSTNYFKVITFYNTDELITMYPTNEVYPNIVEELNYIKFNKDDSKVKRLSQIEKFNKKFNR